MSGPERRAPVQSERSMPGYREVPAGTVAWAEHEEAWEVYATRYGRSQSAERMAERGGFGYWEMTDLLRREPDSWRKR